MARTLITNGRIVTAADDFIADLLIEDGRIAAIGADLAAADAEIHDAAGYLVFPGGVDVHTHLEAAIGGAKTVDTFESGTMAAAFGGTTTVVDFAQQPKGDSVMAGFADWRRRAENACVDVGAHMIVSDFHDQTLVDMEAMLKRDGVTSFKMFMAVPGRMMLDDGELLRIMRMTGANGGLSCVHAENGLLIEQLIKDALAEGRNEVLNHPRVHPPETEGEAVYRAIQIAKIARAPLYIVHVSTANAVGSIAEARYGGAPVYAETCPHYLFLTEKEYDTPGWDAAKYTMIPPLRSQAHVDELWRGLAADDLQVVATDHCPFCLNEHSRGKEYSKEMFGRESFAQLPNGAPGIETRMTLLYDGGVRAGRFSLNRFVDITATAPAKLFGLYPRKGTIEAGADADLVLFDPDAKWTIRAAEQHSRIDYSLYEGREVTGRVKKVFLRGELIVEGDKWLGRAGGGQYLARGPSGAV